MDILLGSLLRLVVLCASVAVPGWAALRLSGFRSHSRVDALLAMLAIGAAYTAEAVTVLLLAHVYTRPTLVLALAAPVIAAIVFPRRPVPAAELSDIAPGRSPVDRAVLTACAVFVGVYLIDAATSPMTWWDGLATWGKWAADWGRRTDSANYLVGGYPQLVPRIISVLYKFTGSGDRILPLDFFAAHAFHVLFSAWFIVAAVRLSDLLEVPVWPAVLAGVGSLLFREHTGAGTVDVLVAAQVATLLALYVGWTRRSWETTRLRPAWVFGVCVFGALFTKWTGVVGPFLMLALRAGVRPAPIAVAGTGTVRRALATGVLLLLPFVLEQGYTELRRDRFEPQPSEVNLSIRQTPGIVATDAELTYRNGSRLERLELLQLRFWNSYEVPARLRQSFSIFLAGCLLLSLGSAVARAVVPVLAAFTLMWVAWSSYDQRNVFALLPIAGIAAVYGARAAWRLRPALIWQSGVALFAGLFLLFTGTGLLKDVQRRVETLRTGERRLAARLHAMRGSPGDRIALFYPEYNGDYQIVRKLSDLTHATHVLVTSPMYRFFTNGAHPWGVWPYHRLTPGDVFAGHESQRPPSMQGWVLVRQAARHRVWVFDPSVAARHRSSDSSPLPDAEGRVTFSVDVPVEEILPGGFLLWQMEIEGRGPNADVVYEGRGVHVAALSSSATEVLDDGTMRVSGLVAPDPGAFPADSTAAIRIRVTVGGTDGSPMLRDFRSSSPPGPASPRPS